MPESKYTLPPSLPDLPSGWNWIPLGDLMDQERGICYGIVQPGKHDEEGVPMVNTGDILNGEPKKNIEFKVSKSLHAKFKRSTLRGGEILITLVGANFGRVAIAPHEYSGYNCSRAVGVVPVVLDAEYIMFALQTPIVRYYMDNWANTTAQPTFNLGDVTNLPIAWAPEDKREQISSLISSLDGKLKLNRQINQTLEQIAQAIFKSWFVDFEPVKAKIQAKQNGQDPERAAMRAISGKTDEELDQLEAQGRANVAGGTTPGATSPPYYEQLTAVAALFPDELEDTELGEIPKGWEYGTLSDVCVFSDERIDVAKLTVENYISTENMLEGKRGVTTATSLPTVKTVPYFTVGHILVSNIRPYFMKIWLSQFEGGRSADVLGIKAADSDSIEFLYNLLYQDTFFNYMMATSKGAKMPRGDKDAIMRWVIPLPALDIRRAYSMIVKGYYELIENNNQENQNLADIRNVLLPKLLSGEVVCSNAQVKMEAIA